MSETSLLMEAASDVARVAGDIAHSFFRTPLDVRKKSDGSPVTIADQSAESAARTWIEKRFPADIIVGEEFGATGGSGSKRWIIDPIDGTKTFVRGVPLWGTLIAVVEGEEVKAGAAYFPALGEMLCAAQGEGCWWNGVRAWVSPVETLAEAMVLTTDERYSAAPEHLEAWQRLGRGAGMQRSWGDCYGYLLVATGRAEVMTDPQLSEWDAAALMPAVTEAGGVFTDWSGKATAFGGSAIATNRALAVEARATLGAST
jgi:histidinol phosphatase-like enzyme (inositol monophosphatase family)